MSVIRVDAIQKFFGDVRAVEDVSFSVGEGEIFGILGPNGAGKTTTVECVAGALVPDSGSVTVLGADPVRTPRFVRENVGYQLQSSTLPPALRVGEAVDLFAAFYESSVDTAEVLDVVGLTAERRRPYGKLSGGQKQRLSIALALIGAPRIAVFDELTTCLDPVGRRDIWQLVERVRDSGVTVLLVTHFLDEVERLCDRLALIDRGRTVFVGTPDQLREAVPTPAGEGSTLEDAYVRFLGSGRHTEQGQED
ncbi:ABC transporter ATP-binding protein [Microbacterium wangchenii]|uniref:ABC transporter ATP-binding protein n=1 Tax=Microbacterium wangchenii TaxID=2541726 RepID=UPI0011CAA6E6|nr:ABC transporter ATP-binding protein [Microbacterium wangchenii]TXK14821.1 ABC transporter ATP-binding protein [Microbacterium wangchenii]